MEAEILYYKDITGAPGGREHNEVRTIFEDVEENIEISIYDISVQRTWTNPNLSGC